MTLALYQRQPTGTCYIPTTMSKRATFLRISAIRIALALAVAGVALALTMPAPNRRADARRR